MQVTNSTPKNNPMTPESVKQVVEKRLDLLYEQRTIQAQGLDEHYRRLWEAARQQHRSGGKRLRPYLALLAYTGFGGTNNGAMVDVASALELLHTALLMHDDIIDDDFTRHNQPNVSGLYMQKYLDAGVSKARVKHYAHSAALLAGDNLISDSYQLILSSGFTSEQKLTALGILGEIIFLVGGGQFLDSEATFEPFDAVDCIKVARYKTASYSFVGPLSMGATLAGAKGSDLERIQTYGENIGIAFQLMDDILGIFGDEQTLGKSTTGDIKEGKRTLLMQYALAHGDSKTTNRLQSLLGNNKVTARDTETVKLILEATGAKQYVLEQVQLYKQSALAALRETSLSTDIQAELITIAEKATNRVS